MVAISLYKGNLHKATDVPRRWPSPAPKISLKHFKILLRRRARALSRLSTDVATTSNPNPSPAPNSCGNLNPSSTRDATTEINHVDNSELMVKGQLKKGEGDKKDTGEDRKEVDEDSVLAVKEKEDAEAVKNDGGSETPVNKAIEKINDENATSGADKRINEVKEKLVVLNEKKHGLVQVLKQILTAEEHLKRQNCAQGMPSRPPLPLQVDTTTDSGSMIRVNTPRIGKDGNPCGDMEGGEADDVSNHNLHSRHLVRTSSCSPSSDSQQKKPFSNAVPHSYRTTLAVAGSPSRFAPAAQGPPSVSISGASYIASSPSPAASGGTSVFRDGRLPSPWN
ncbi:uncharacterized protein LOC125213714 [Salvia hispanica]|uniref:uncharacterized protein LOC125213714 n=1 Tax=Salvia hispanica TaxID=49212 RepID=UPI00200929AC|nr:uncharacterized protein LOC125213714 [Salvia hispanica]